MRVLKLSCVVVSVLCAASCASISSVPLGTDGNTKISGAEEGIRYYRPKPYVLITELPVSPQTPSSGPAAAAPAGKNASTQTPSPTPTTASQPQSAAPSAPASDTSFSASMASYSVKLVYLPDYEHPMALKMTAGLFGTTSSNPTLQDGWMLTSLSGSVDSGGAAALSAIAGLATTSATGGATAAAKGGAAAAVAPDTSLLPHSLNPDNPKSLKNYDAMTLALYGQSVGQGSLAAPPRADVAALSPSQLSTFMTAIAVGAKSIVTASQTVPLTVTWGKNVLPPGLYNFDDKSGLTAVIYFCADGPQAPKADKSTPCPHPAQ
jgi:hypothetical protein